MKKTKIYISLILSVFMLIATQTKGQLYDKSVEVRSGIMSGVGYEVKMGYASYELCLMGYDNSVQIGGLIKHYFPLSDLGKSWNYFVGGGLHIGVSSNHPSEQDFYTYGRFPRSYVGADFVAGIEYQLMKIPLVIGLDARPFLNIGRKKLFELKLFDFGINVKYIF